VRFGCHTRFRTLSTATSRGMLNERRACTGLRYLFFFGISLAFWLLATYPAQAQAFGDWEEGTVILGNGDTLSGRLFVNLDVDLVEVESQGAIKTFTAFQVLLVRLYEPAKLYASHSAALRGTMQVPMFFEVLHPGAFATLLGRERISHNNAPLVDQYGQTLGTFYGEKNYQYDFFLMNARGRVRRVPVKRSELARFLENDPPAVLVDYIRRNKPDPTERADLVALISFYNHLKADQLPVQR